MIADDLMDISAMDPESESGGEVLAAAVASELDAVNTDLQRTGLVVNYSRPPTYKEFK
jgi:hypothetical protein